MIWDSIRTYSLLIFGYINNPRSWLYQSDDPVCDWAINAAAAAAVTAACDVIDGPNRFSNFLVSGLYMGCLNLQWVRKLSLRVYVARHSGHSNLPGKWTW